MSFVPLVEPGPQLSRRDLARYARHLALPDLGESGQRRLRNARVLVIGAGGLGSPVLLYLAAAGVGTLGIIDDDAVDESNLQRQVIHQRAAVGTLKVDSAAKTLAALDDTVTVVTYPQRLTVDNALSLFADYDIVLDGTDNFATRYLSNDAAELTGTPLVWGTIFRFAGQVSVFWKDQGPTLRDLFPEIPDPDSVPTCAEGGVLGALCGTIGSIMAGEAIKVITGIGEPLVGRVLLYDALSLSMRTISLRPDPQRPPVTSLEEVAWACSSATTPRVPQLAAQEAVAAHQADPDGVVLVDVREPFERDIVRIPGDVHVPLARIEAEGWHALEQVLAGPGSAEVPVAAAPAGDPAGPPARAAGPQQVVLYCKAGIRSERAALRLAGDHRPGLPEVANLEGGVLAWVRDVAPDEPTY